MEACCDPGPNLHQPNLPHGFAVRKNREEENYTGHLGSPLERKVGYKSEVNNKSLILFSRSCGIISRSNLIINRADLKSVSLDNSAGFGFFFILHLVFCLNITLFCYFISFPLGEALCPNSCSDCHGD